MGTNKTQKRQHATSDVEDRELGDEVTNSNLVTIIMSNEAGVLTWRNMGRSQWIVDIETWLP